MWFAKTCSISRLTVFNRLPCKEEVYEQAAEIRYHNDLKYETLTTLIVASPEQFQEQLTWGDPFLAESAYNPKANRIALSSVLILAAGNTEIRRRSHALGMVVRLSQLAMVLRVQNWLGK